MSSSGGGTEEKGKPATTSNKEAAEADPPVDSPKHAPKSSLPGIGTDRTKSPADHPESPAPMAYPTAYPQLYAQHLTPQPGGGYYMYQQAQVTPEPPSPAGAHGMYDAASFRQQHFLSNPFGGQAYGGVPPPPLSPRTGMGSMGSLPPPSPLFPRVAANSAGRLSPGGNGRAPPSPSPYLSPPLGPAVPSYGAVYQTYSYGGAYNNGGIGAGPEDDTAWSDRSQQNLYQQASPQQYGVTGLQRQLSNSAYSFDEMLPPSVLDPSDHSNPSYSPYGGSQRAPAGVSGTLFAQQTWGYGSSGDMYNAPSSPSTPRQTLSHMPGQFGGGAPVRPAGPYGGQFYPVSSPGPPIQTTDSNKGPDGANLFIFHIPNHFTNLDMYHLFCPYGNLLSVRIMVERDTGRSRGFGFVSYDNPESAAMAIKELNGFAIGNKRLKVQHKQIRSHDEHHGHSPGYQGGEHAAGGEDSHGGWYEEPKGAPQAAPEADDGDQNSYVDKEEGVDVHHSGLGNLDPLRNALPDLTGQSKGKSSFDSGI